MEGNKVRAKGSRQAFGPRAIFMGRGTEEGSHHQTRGSNRSFPNGSVNKVRTLGGGSGKGPDIESQAPEVRTRPLFYSMSLKSPIWSQGLCDMNLLGLL